ncbi:hypothetical protein QJS10_CPA01g01534 [Acorus calamus]|uniref:Uncharacterized protein n=1 Tax=Acorus calamus TaxID=4465 RepID=A0AAV9FJH6_ACOCL|nr:hypothetical protein QJS10_CPA01g01534 [Acorus calamus]
MEKICQGFLWGGEEGKKKIHAVCWADVCLPKEEGGLGFKRIGEWNRDAMGKRFWEIVFNNCSLWASWMKARYCKRKSVWNADLPSFGSSLWQQILNSIEWIRANVQYVVFEGKSIRLWDDPWLNGFGLKHHFKTKHFFFGVPQMRQQ